MSGSVILIVVFLMIACVYMRRKFKNNSAKNIDSVKAYHDMHNRINDKKKSVDSNGAYRRYVTRYNSPEDFREK